MAFHQSGARYVHRSAPKWNPMPNGDISKETGLRIAQRRMGGDNDLVAGGHAA
jgi:hypothetical protein